ENLALLRAAGWVDGAEGSQVAAVDDAVELAAIVGPQLGIGIGPAGAPCHQLELARRVAEHPRRFRDDSLIAQRVGLLGDDGASANPRYACQQGEQARCSEILVHDIPSVAATNVKIISPTSRPGRVGGI